MCILSVTCPTVRLPNAPSFALAGYIKIKHARPQTRPTNKVLIKPIRARTSLMWRGGGLPTLGVGVGAGLTCVD